MKGKIGSFLVISGMTLVAAVMPGAPAPGVGGHAGQHAANMTASANPFVDIYDHLRKVFLF